MEGGAVRHNFEMGLPKDYPHQSWFSDLDNSAREFNKVVKKRFQI
jgi:hypothetical protein